MRQRLHVLVMQARKNKLYGVVVLNKSFEKGFMLVLNEFFRSQIVEDAWTAGRAMMH